jgi:hypothetical protein
MKEKIVFCSCRSLDHVFKFVHFTDDMWVYLETHLSKTNLFRRLWYAIKYVFGYESHFGATDEVVLTLEQIKDINLFLESVIRQMELNDKQKTC